MAAENHLPFPVEEDLARRIIDELGVAFFPEDPLYLEEGLALAAFAL